MILLIFICTCRQVGLVDGEEQEHFSPVNSLRKNSIILTTKMAALSHGCKPGIFR